MLQRKGCYEERKENVRVDRAQKRHITHHDHRAHEGDVGEEVARLGEAARLKLKLTRICPQEVWVHEQAKLGACDEERRDKAPNLRQGTPCEDIVGDPRDVVRADQFHVHWHRESNSDGGDGPADQYQKCVPGGVGVLRGRIPCNRRRGPEHIHGGHDCYTRKEYNLVFFVGMHR